MTALDDLCMENTAMAWCPVWNFIKNSWYYVLIGIILLFILFVFIKVKRRGYFWKARKTGEHLSLKQFLGLWRRGIEGITKIQKVRGNLWGTRIIMMGISLGIIMTAITHIKGMWWWIEIILIGSFIPTIFQWIGLKQEYWRIKKTEEEIKRIQDEEKLLSMISVDNKEVIISTAGKEKVGMSSMGFNIDEEIKKGMEKKKSIIVFDEASNIRKDQFGKAYKIMKEYLDKKEEKK